ncbi:MAG: hypothetical protein SCARUB_05088 [Candidatus Scalindua rubra]|uniref:Uncharacterized protein n=1 Tax=Candidatus Scalindua rubra TaxID=1872076 RepID=A0A1E3X2L0_9BACT|nr:MAG: hypothetical protein SCARUB_05088 [Candidatus Scalindua rubra]
MSKRKKSDDSCDESIQLRVREKITLQSCVELSQMYGFSHLSKRLISA